MKRFITLETVNGSKVRLLLQNWGTGVDPAYRRWVREGGRWQCVETGELANKSRLIFGQRRHRAS